MNETDAIVVRIEGDFAWVRVAGPGPACGSCAQKGGCATSGMGNLLDETGGGERKPKLLRLPNTLNARRGDSVVIRAADGMVLKAVWRAYGIPLGFSMGGALLATWMSASELAAIAGTLLGLATGFLLLRRQGLDSSRAEPILSMGFKQTSVISVKDHETC